ncbi:MAG: hypothetical protein Q8K00_03265 [Syntrophales bacterium]|nr:hypothetical protein [Syntrophales bacterium]
MKNGITVFALPVLVLSFFHLSNGIQSPIGRLGEFATFKERNERRMK